MEEDIKILKALRNYNKFYKEENGKLTITIDLDLKTDLDKALENLLTRYKQLEEKSKLQNERNKRQQEENKKLNQKILNQKGQLKVLYEQQKELKQENEEWQRAYQEEKDKQFELLRENKELKDRIKDFLKSKGVTDIQITAIKHQGYIEGFAQRDKLARELCEDCRKAEKNLYEEGLQVIQKYETELEKKDKRISDLEFALMDMVLQFADESKDKISTMGLSALEIAFSELDFDNPMPIKEVHKRYKKLAQEYYKVEREGK